MLNALLFRSLFFYNQIIKSISEEKSMLTPRENVIETMKKDGHPDRFVKQFEFLGLIPEDVYYMGDYPLIPGNEGYDQYGVFWTMPEGQMGAFPVHDDQHRVLKDITQWREVVKKPAVPPVPAYIDMLKGKIASVDRSRQFVCALQTQGVFERLHALMGMEDCFVNFFEEPEEMHALIDFIVEVELEFAHFMVDLGIEAVLHHDDWGATENSFLSPEMFEEFILPAYKKIYGYYKENGILIVHHNDGWSANLVPYMIEMGIDIWQGVIPANDMPKLLDQTDGAITFMGEIETRLLDVPDWTPEMVKAEVERACRKIGPRRNFIPCLTAGMPFTAFGVGSAVDAEIDRMSEEMF